MLTIELIRIALKNITVLKNYGQHSKPLCDKNSSVIYTTRKSTINTLFTKLIYLVTRTIIAKLLIDIY